MGFRVKRHATLDSTRDRLRERATDLSARASGQSKRLFTKNLNFKSIFLLVTFLFLFNMIVSSSQLYAKAYSVDRSLESALEALCDLSPSKAFRLGGSCNRDVDVDAATTDETRTHDIPHFSRRRFDL